MVVSAQTVVRAMRGDSKSYLLGTNDGNYVTKFAWRIGARRRLINDWAGSKLLSRLGLATPSVRLVETSVDFIEAHRGELSATGLEPLSLRGLHFGSQFPGDPATSIVYDCLPDRFLAKVENLQDFVGTLLVDLWCGKASARQAIFVRSVGNTGLFRALMIDNHQMFGGESWSLEDASAPGLHLSKTPYAMLAGMASFNPWLNKIRSIPESFFLSLASDLPGEWKEPDGLAFTELLEQLSTRRNLLRSHAATYLRSNGKLFPRWAPENSAKLWSLATSTAEPAVDCQWQTIGEARGLTSDKSAFTAAAYSDGARANCVGDGNLLLQLRQSAAREAVVPDAVTNVAKAILTATREATGLARNALRQITAILQYDSMFDLQPAGARSLPLGCGSRLLLFRAGEYSVDLRLETEPEFLTWTLVGQLSHDDMPSDQMADLPVLVMAGKKLVGKTLSNEFGEFILSELPRQRLRLFVPLAAEGQQIELALNRFQETPDPARN